MKVVRKNVELDRCTHLVHFLSSEDYPSFNLAQAVLLAAYELRRASLREPEGEPPEVPAEHRAARGDVLAPGARAPRHRFPATGYRAGDDAQVRRILRRAALTPGDAKILRGIARQILWLAGRSSPGRGAEPERG